MSVRKLNLPCVLGGLAVAALALSGCSTSAPDAQRDESSGEITESAEANVFSIAVGDCLDLSDSSMSNEVSSLPTVPCSDEHDSEVYAETTLDGEEYPADLDDQAGQYCYDQFASFVGKAYEESSLDFQYLTPTQDGWEQGNDRSVQCILLSPEPVTASLAGSAL